MAFLGRIGALIEILSLPVFAWLYGAATMGLFFTLWSYVKVISGFAEFGMTTALQRYVASTNDKTRVHAALRIALTASTLVSVTIAALLSSFADQLAPLLNADPADAERLVLIIRLYAWAIPLWTAVEVVTSSVRAQQAFGPEIRIRVFYEQSLRLVAAVIFFALGMNYLGLFLAHLVSLSLATLFAIRLMGQLYELKRLFRRLPQPGLLFDMLTFGGPMAQATLIKRLHSELPVMVLNAILPGAAGATAAALFGTARKITSSMHTLRMSFSYVIAPMASERHGAEDRAGLGDMYAFASRISATLVIPAATFLILIRQDLLALFTPAFSAAAPAILILAIGRALETAVGPASAVVEMLGHRLLPLLNGLAGLLALVGLLYWLAPSHGATGAAVATAIGLNVTSLIGLAQARFLYDLSLYTTDLMRPLVISIIGAGLMVLAVYPVFSLGPPWTFMAALASGALAVFILVRVGYSDRDAAALGRLANFFGRKVENPA